MRHSPSNWRLLLIDDEADILDVLSMTLLDGGYQIKTALDGEAGLLVWADYKPDIVITDIRMPKKNGIQVLEQIKKQTPDVEVIVVTAFAEMELAVKALQLEASDFITKPISATALMVAIDRAKTRILTRRKLKQYTALLEEDLANTHQELLEAYTFQQKLIESSMDGILGCDQNERVITFNKSMQCMSGYTFNQVVQKKRLSDFFDQKRYDDFLQKLSGNDCGGPNRLNLYETVMLTKEKEAVCVQLTAQELMEDGVSQGRVCFIRDLRQIRRLEQQMADQAHILHQDKMISLGRLAASVAHEVNNPLAGVLNYLRLMNRIVSKQTSSIKDNSKFQTYLTTAEKEVERCTRIVGNLLTFARKTDVVYHALDLSDLMQRCMVLSGHRLELNRIEINLDIKEPLPAVNGDFNQLQQCLINLIFNAIDAMPNGGYLALKLFAAGNPEKVVITVSDNGCGIADKDLAYIFDPFFTTKKNGQGTGLGLSTTAGIIEAHNGTITVKSHVGKGTVFTVTLPART